MAVVLGAVGVNFIRPDNLPPFYLATALIIAAYCFREIKSRRRSAGE
ncbi:hypothetical protein [Streptomyces sp. NBC_01445]|nr:hypothetical protein [Streptomyces sp. NBC_01445]WSE10167.1 hypothetical protein OG574_46785 [Streptomyces sp. NBC_01445]